MKTKLVAIVLLVTGGLLLSSCDETENDLLKDLAKGKMTVVINDGTPELLTCNFGTYGEEGSAGEVFIRGSLISSKSDSFFSIMYGSWDNKKALAEKSYSTKNEADMMNVHGSYGYADETYPVTVVITKVSSTEIKGTFSGKLKTPDEGVVDVKGAFWAIPEEAQR